MPFEKLLKATNQDPATRQILTSVYQNAGQLLRLINQLLDLYILEGGNMGISLMRGDAIAFITRLAETLRPLALSRQLTLHIDSDATIANRLDGPGLDSPWLFDADKWEKIITNLLANAIKFTPAGWRVLLTLEQTSPGQLVVEVSDAGIGISAPQLAHIFDRLSLGLTGNLNPGASSEVVTVSATVLPTNIREAVLTNNVDADKVEYFQQ